MCCPGAVAMYRFFTPAVVMTAILVLSAFALSTEAAAACGGKDQKACGFSSAKRHTKGLCPRGSFLDIGRQECWSCPAGHDRTVTAVTAAKACRKPGRTVPAKAKYHKNVGCSGARVFYDPRNGGECWRCPSGYGRTLAAVTAKNACAKGVLGKTARASYVGKHGCTGKGVFYDPRKGGQCWSCPKGYDRGVSAVTSSNACYRPVAAAHAKATFRSRAGCPRGGFYDIGRGECWSCNAGYDRSVLPVTGSRACVAARHCGKGLIEIGGVCRKRGQCGGRNQRPCLIAERVPSCNKGLREDFRKNRCLALKKGETPFTAGLASLAGEVSRTSEICNSVLQAMPSLKSGIPAVDAGAACTRNMQIGFVCALPKAADKVKDTAELFQRVNREYQSSPCKDRLTWYHARARKHGKAKGLKCPGRQFFDLTAGGSCWSCPRGHTRSLEPVTSRAACVRASGTPAMFRSACAGTMALVRDAGKQLRCLAAMVKSGVLARGFRGKQREMCQFAGEEAYFTTLDILTATTNPKTRLERLVKKLRKVNSALNKASTANDFMNKVDALRACEGVFDRTASSGRTYNIGVGAGGKKETKPGKKEDQRYNIKVK